MLNFFYSISFKRIVKGFFLLILFFHYINSSSAQCTPPNLDFSFKQDNCNPLLIQFTNISYPFAANSYSWDFGDGTFSTIDNPSKLYTSYSNYTITLRNTNGCITSIKKTIPVQINTENLIININKKDTTICINDSVLLKAVSLTNYCWTPSAGLSNTTTGNVIAKPLVTTTYYLNSQIIDTNLIKNADFEMGHTLFHSDYSYSDTANGGFPEGAYTVNTSAYVNNWHLFISNCSDHTTGKGKQMIVNGARFPKTVVWRQDSLPVLPYTNYVFSLWVQSLYKDVPARLQFSINGKTVGDTFHASLDTCIWQQFFTTWNSGDSTMASISIINQNTDTTGNDFALDDLSFHSVILKRDSVTITVVAPPTPSATKNPSLCVGYTLQLIAAPALSYNWSTGTTNDTAIVSPATSIDYTVQRFSMPGCFSTDTFRVTVNKNPVVKITNTITKFCEADSFQLNATGTNTYNWNANSYLSDTTIANPIAKPLQDTVFIVKGFDGHCFALDTFKVTINPLPTLSVTKNSSLCIGDSIQLLATSNADNYSWSPFLTLSASNIFNPFAKPTDSTTYVVTVTDSKCSRKDSVTILVNIPPVASATTNTSVCSGKPVQLIAATANSYSWITGITTKADTVSPLVNTTYTVKRYSDKGCFSTDTFRVATVSNPPVKILNKPGAICKADSFKLQATGASTYKWNATSYLSDTTIATPIAKPLADTSFIVTGFDGYGCFASDTVNLVVNNPPSLVLTKDTGVCIKDSIQLSGITTPSTNTYSWQADLSLSSLTISNPFAMPTDNRTYYLTVTDINNGCTTKDSVKVNAWPLPTVMARSDTSICLQTTLVLNTISSNASRFVWQPSIGLSADTAQSPIDTALSVSKVKYTVTAYTNKGCKATDNVSITGLSLPNITIPKDTLMVCVGKPIKLQANVNNSKGFIWSPSKGLSDSSALNPDASPAVSTNYHLQVTGSNNCVATDSEYVKVKALPVFSITPNTGICKDSLIVITASGGNKYKWQSLANYPDSSSNTFKPLVTTIYKVTATDTICAVSSPLSSTVTVYNPPSLTITKSNDIDCIVTSAKLNASGADHYIWAPADSLLNKNATTASPIAIPSQTTRYTVKGYSSQGCETDSFVVVNVTKNGADGSYLVPSAFTPAGNTVNNCFGISRWGSTWSNITNIQMNIYNRFGQKLYSTNNINDCWDGRVNGVLQASGAFIYEIKAVTFCGVLYKKSTFVLIR
ncbi:PKD domain-containing protein [Parasediminibacterium sp. JCM 36343]|uniref:PKD domain-containing protein n=1 Tax=Parasediminibacterium sp. JCM 36343 TaxID=3374279 RepID=UPI00397D122F